ncbi:hypothetical protein BCR39DRAFT_521486 [Naematelia encephala]|uniref:Uncharacterized protein n=1 Tax=Naematelia encephala TaxID=71784 RepID=A0A1Y2BE92_9TREE|nr:hypothetical protein BCR39DRAFT_521486 [Naematelia encephala]
MARKVRGEAPATAAAKSKPRVGSSTRRLPPPASPSSSSSSPSPPPPPPPMSTVRDSSSSSKRGVMEICDRWLSANDSYTQDSGSSRPTFGYITSSELPNSSPFLPSSATLVGTQSTNGKKRKFAPGQQASDEDEDEDEDDMQFDLRTALQAKVTSGSSSPSPVDQRPVKFRPTPRPPGAEDGSTILVKMQHNYFPGYVVEYLPAQTIEDQRKGMDRYRVCTQLDGEILKRRNEIILLSEDGIADCRLGEIRTTVTSINNDATTRPPTPPPRTTRRAKPLSPAAFGKLSREAQIRYLHPLLHDIIKEAYTCSQWRADAFYGSTVQRAALKQEAQYGDIREAELVTVIVPELERWALRAERWQGVAKQSDDEPARPVGSERYESLSITERRNFVTDVLLPEAIIQICILSFDHPASDSPQQLYGQARKRLGELAMEDDVSGWNMRLVEIYEARSRMRKRKGLPREDLTSFEKRQIRVVEGELVSWTGRIRKVFGADIKGVAPINAPLVGI